MHIWNVQHVAMDRQEITYLQFSVRKISDRSEFDPDKPMGNVGNRFDMFWVGIHKPATDEFLSGDLIGYAVINPDWDSGKEECFSVSFNFELHGWNGVLQKRIQDYFRTTAEYGMQKAWVRKHILNRLEGRKEAV